MLTRVIRVHECGGPDVLRQETVEVPPPSVGEVLVRNCAIGLNFIDVCFRTGRYRAAIPFIPGLEGAGIVEEIGPRVEGISVGDRVGYIDPLGAYAEFLLRPAARLIKLPDSIDLRDAAAMLLKGMTAEYLLNRTYPVRAGEVVLIHSAAGGVGQILCQWAKHLGAEVIGTVGSAAKKHLAQRAGCDHIIVMDEEEFAPRVREITSGKGVPVVYDGIGATSFRGSLDCLSRLGTMVSFGNASGSIPPFDVQVLANKGSLFITRPGLASYTVSREDLETSATRLFSVVEQGAVKVEIGQCYPLADAARAHRDLEGRRLTGSNILLT
ncbi:quinone oxidoreductase [Sphingobium sp. BS19]|uniref:quinone oxidoreductase family protein n=1 Tax=Sphingobium sp. BS19 TaxID=3018973 RepID=UPI0022EF02E3|nr:quinone oxidoreductase [Sphingobium sp. BS19]GLJ00646.1 quinone oxidoreductase [Sphingobium sp. BS19]